MVLWLCTSRDVEVQQTVTCTTFTFQYPKIGGCPVVIARSFGPMISRTVRLGFGPLAASLSSQLACGSAPIVEQQLIAYPGLHMLEDPRQVPKRLEKPQKILCTQTACMSIYSGIAIMLHIDCLRL
jgi:hypothetical protein